MDIYYFGSFSYIIQENNSLTKFVRRSYMVTIMGLKKLFSFSFYVSIKCKTFRCISAIFFVIKYILIRLMYNINSEKNNLFIMCFQIFSTDNFHSSLSSYFVCVAVKSLNIRCLMQFLWISHWFYFDLFP